MTVEGNGSRLFVVHCSGAIAKAIRLYTNKVPMKVAGLK